MSHEKSILKGLLVNFHKKVIKYKVINLILELKNISYSWSMAPVKHISKIVNF